MVQSSTRLAFIVFVLVAGFTSIGHSAPSACPEHYPGGVSPGIERPQLAAETYELCFREFAVIYSGISRTPLASAEHLTRDSVQSGRGLRREDVFHEEERLPPDQRARLSDYARSGFDRGHMAPAADMKFSREAMIQSFYLSNMAPQIGPGMNRGIWADLEKLTRQWVCAHGRLVAISGPIYEDAAKTVGDDKVAVPSAFYKILYEPERKRIIAFVLPNRSIDKEGRSAIEALKPFMVKAGDIEDRVGLSFLDGLSSRDRSRLLDMAPAMWTRRDLC